MQLKDFIVTKEEKIARMMFGYYLNMFEEQVVNENLNSGKPIPGCEMSNNENLWWVGTGAEKQLAIAAIEKILSAKAPTLKNKDQCLKNLISHMGFKIADCDEEKVLSQAHSSFVEKVKKFEDGIVSMLKQVTNANPDVALSALTDKFGVILTKAKKHADIPFV